MKARNALFCVFLILDGVMCAGGKKFPGKSISISGVTPVNTEKGKCHSRALGKYLFLTPKESLCSAKLGGKSIKRSRFISRDMNSMPW